MMNMRERGESVVRLSNVEERKGMTRAVPAKNTGWKFDYEFGLTPLLAYGWSPDILRNSGGGGGVSASFCVVNPENGFVEL